MHLISINVVNSLVLCVHSNPFRARVHEPFASLPHRIYWCATQFFVHTQSTPSRHSPHHNHIQHFPCDLNGFIIVFALCPGDRCESPTSDLLPNCFPYARASCAFNCNPLKKYWPFLSRGDRPSKSPQIFACSLHYRNHNIEFLFEQCFLCIIKINVVVIAKKFYSTENEWIFMISFFLRIIISIKIILLALNNTLLCQTNSIPTSRVTLDSRVIWYTFCRLWASLHCTTHEILQVILVRSLRFVGINSECIRSKSVCLDGTMQRDCESLQLFCMWMPALWGCAFDAYFHCIFPFVFRFDVRQWIGMVTWIQMERILRRHSTASAIER